MTAALEHDWNAGLARRTHALGGGEITAILALAGATDVITFSGGFPDPATWPRDVLAGLAAKLITDDAPVALQYAATEGLASVRDFVSGRLGRIEGRTPAAGELMITSGGIDCMELLAKSYLDPGDVVVVEAPTYLGAIQSFRTFEAKLDAVPLDEDGLQVDELEARLHGGLRPKLVYTIPDHQNPAGVSLASDRRSALVELARRHRFLIVEDVAYRELGFGGEALPSLWSLAPDLVVQAGTTSKTLFPGVRLGWAIAPPEVAARLVSAKQTTDQCAGAFGQRVFEEFQRRGWIDEQVARSRALYERKCARLLAALERSMPEGARWTTPHGGFFSWLTLPGVDTSELAKRAVEQRVGIVPGSLFFPDGDGAESVRLSFSLVDEEQIDEGIERLVLLVG